MKIAFLIVFLVLLISGCVQEQSVQSKFDISFDYPKEIKCNMPFSVKVKMTNNIDHSIKNVVVAVEDLSSMDIKSIECEQGKKTSNECSLSQIEQGDERIVIFTFMPPKDFCMSGNGVTIVPRISVSYDSLDESSISVPIYTQNLKIGSISSDYTNGPVKAEIKLSSNNEGISPNEVVVSTINFISDETSDVIIKGNNIKIKLVNFEIYDNQACDFTNLGDFKVNYNPPLFCSLKAGNKPGEYAKISVEYSYNYKIYKDIEISSKSEI
ncbi:MAG: hypothetical protein QXM68_03500 [Candidatus Aenigmatarchaeota archaeon]|nr:hypothetical protein [Candidatus Aenigmarchaeota archaeon]